MDEPPVEMEHVACEAHDHRPHAEVHEARGRQTSHHSIDQRVTSGAVSPCLVQPLVVLELQVAVAWMERMELEFRFRFKPLSKVVSPMQPTQERLKTLLPP